ncbi:MAG TPA: 16S rRNA (cytosine(1402)-N(4))-methyltransferase RsmH [Candidatus Wildermuthbacteria bacterium]|nr:16S rRNA (cytosine(1402)-N(4))-methyltransferase RsmH [Candidatus Wildermuthbacteria bacterium]
MHVPVLTKELIELLEPKANENFIDCTVGSGGHTKAILAKTEPRGKVLAIDRDKDSIRRAKEILRRKLNRVTFIQGNFADLSEIVKEEKFQKVRGIIFDLGYSSDQLEEGGRGLSFQKTEPLDMRYDTQVQKTAAKIINYESRQELERILKEYGEEKFARQIAEAIVNKRRDKQITTTTELVNIIKEAVPGFYRRAKINPATKTFQALRIAVNKELESLRAALPKAIEILEPGGRIGVISFHSLEDRIVKRFFNETETIEVITKKPTTPGVGEVGENARSRSAKLRVAEKQ